MKKTILLLTVFFSFVCAVPQCMSQRVPVIGIAWYSDTTIEFITNIRRTFDQLNVRTVLLPMVVDSLLPYEGDVLAPSCSDSNNMLLPTAASLVKSSTYRHSNVQQVLRGVDAVIFAGGEDVSPTLYRVPQPSHAIREELDYNAIRDVSDYLLMTYCLDHDIPFLSICRGMQMLGIVSGASVIQDIPTWFAQQQLPYRFEHRKSLPTYPYRDYALHDVTIVPNSLLASLADTILLSGCPSWHHQALADCAGTPLSIVATTVTSGVPAIEAIQRTDCTFALGIQFHPEAAVVKYLDHKPTPAGLLDFHQALSLFRRFVDRLK